MNTAFSTTFVAVRALWSAIWDQAQFPRRKGHPIHYYCTRCSVRVRVFFSQNRQQGCDISLGGSSSRVRFSIDVEAGMGRGE